LNRVALEKVNQVDSAAISFESTLHPTCVSLSPQGELTMRFVSVLAAVAALWVQPAIAATIVQTVSTNSLVFGSLALFDTSLGTLDSVDLTSTINFSAGPIGRANTDVFPEVTTPASGTGNLTLGYNNVALASVPLTGTIFYPQGSSFGSLNLSGTASATLTGNILANFVGSGTTLVGVFGGVNPNRPFAYGTGVFTYNYTPAVPEPATWLSMILGFGLIGGALRRRPKPSAPYASVHLPA
jgi:hypothetical protein